MRRDVTTAEQVPGLLERLAGKNEQDSIRAVESLENIMDRGLMDSIRPELYGRMDEEVRPLVFCALIQLLRRCSPDEIGFERLLLYSENPLYQANSWSVLSSWAFMKSLPELFTPRLNYFRQGLFHQDSAVRRSAICIYGAYVDSADMADLERLLNDDVYSLRSLTLERIADKVQNLQRLFDLLMVELSDASKETQLTFSRANWIESCASYLEYNKVICNNADDLLILFAKLQEASFITIEDKPVESLIDYIDQAPRSMLPLSTNLLKLTGFSKEAKHSAFIDSLLHNVQTETQIRTAAFLASCALLPPESTVIVPPEIELSEEDTIKMLGYSGNWKALCEYIQNKRNGSNRGFALYELSFLVTETRHEILQVVLQSLDDENRMVRNNAVAAFERIRSRNPNLNTIEINNAEEKNKAGSKAVPEDDHTWFKGAVSEDPDAARSFMSAIVMRWNSKRSEFPAKEFLEYLPGLIAHIQDSDVSLAVISLFGKYASQYTERVIELSYETNKSSSQFADTLAAIDKDNPRVLKRLEELFQIAPNEQACRALLSIGPPGIKILKGALRTSAHHTQRVIAIELIPHPAKASACIPELLEIVAGPAGGEWRYDDFFGNRANVDNRRAAIAALNAIGKNDPEMVKKIAAADEKHKNKAKQKTGWNTIPDNHKENRIPKFLIDKAQGQAQPENSKSKGGKSWFSSIVDKITRKDQD